VAYRFAAIQAIVRLHAVGWWQYIAGYMRRLTASSLPPPLRRLTKQAAANEDESTTRPMANWTRRTVKTGRAAPHRTVPCRA